MANQVKIFRAQKTGNLKIGFGVDQHRAQDSFLRFAVIGDEGRAGSGSLLRWVKRFHL
jgi:hypothetical protein